MAGQGKAGIAPALFVVKADVETGDDVKLAILEIQGLTGRVPHGVGAECDQGLLAAARGLAVDDQHILVGVAGKETAILVRRLAMIEYIVLPRNGKPVVLETEQTALERSAGAQGTKATSLAAVSRRKNEYLTHSFHKYKAKFFPRMARALANYTTPQGGVVLDPFMGSGTLGLEASLMGVDAHGIDVDPLSVEIARMKIDALHAPTAELRKALEHLLCVIPGGDLEGVLPLHQEPTKADTYVLPNFIGRKIEPAEDRQEIAAEATILRTAIRTCPNDDGRRFLRLALSHALATKISLRWMGTGDNRFALAVARRSLARIMVLHLQKMLRLLEQRDTLAADGRLDLDALGRVAINHGDARRLPYDAETFDGVVTSPPYLPASSGRETYLRSRACSLVALDLATEPEILSREQEMIGSILRSAPSTSDGLPADIVELVEWMLPQRARKPKALATAAYFLDLRASLAEMARVTKKGGKLAIVVSAEHVFYDLLTREVVRRIDMPNAITQLVDDDRNGIPMRIDQVVRIQLPKMDYAARPASNGTYAEAIVLATRT